MTKPLELVVHEDPITGIWSFHLDSHTVEVEPRHGFITIDGHLHQSTAIEGLQDVEDLAGTPLAIIKRLIQLDKAQHDHTHAIPATTPAPTTPRHRAKTDASTPRMPRRRAPRAAAKPSKPRQTKAPLEAFNTTAAAKYLGLSPKTLETKRTRGGGPPFVKLGRRVVYRQTDLDAWLADLCALIDQRRVKRGVYSRRASHCGSSGPRLAQLLVTSGYHQQ